MAIIGHNTVFSNNGGQLQGWSVGHKFAAPSDGWVTDLNCYMHGFTAGCIARLVMWDAARTRVRHGAQQTMGTTFGWKTQSLTPFRVNDGEFIYIGVHCTQSSPEMVEIKRHGTLVDTIREDFTGTNNAADPLAGTQRTDWLQRSIYADYTPNAAPLAPVLSAPSSGAVITTSTMTVAATLPHSSAENAVGEYSTNYRIVVQTTLGTDMINQSFNTTSTEQTNGSFSRSIDISSLPAGDYTVKVQHTDSFGLVGSFSALRSFTIPVPPPAPTLVAPLGKINVISGYNYTATYNNPQSVNANLMEVEVYNSTGTTLLYSGSSGVLNLAPGNNNSLAEFHADLAWASSYQWRARFRDANNIYGDWSAKTSFNTNSVPNAPTGLVPAAGQTYTSLSFYANISDPDNDTMSGGEIEIRRVSDSVVVHTGSMTVDNGTQSMSVTIAGGILVAGTSYQWRCRVGDQNSATQGKGPYSAWTQFTYSTGASVTRIAPVDRINLVENPRAESAALYAGTYWTQEQQVAGAEYIETQSNLDAPSGGGYVWSSYATANKVYASANKIVGPKHTIDATKPYILSAEMKRIAGTNTNSTLALRCYSAADADLGLIYPSNGFAGGLNDQHVANKWTRYGGIAGLSGVLAWPANTAKVRVEIVAANSAGAQVLFDAIQLERLPVLTSTEWNSIKVWFGYADGATVVDESRNTNTWLGTPYLSASSIPPVLSDTTASFLIDYVYGIAKKDDRIKVEQWRSSQWVQILDTGYVAGTRELIPLSNGALPDASRMRVTISARDTTDVEVEVAPFEVDVNYTGPPEILVTEVIANPERASLVAVFEPSTLTTDFAGVQIARSEDGVNFEVITRVDDASATNFEYHAPRSGVSHIFRIRQVQRIPGTSYDIYGRWSSGIGVVDYYPNFFIKDVNDPENILGFRVLQVDHAPYTYGANEDRHELRGDVYPTYYMGDPRSQTAEVTMYLGEGHNLEGTVDERWKKILAFEEDRPTVVFLDSYHDVKWIAQITGDATLDEGLYEGKRRATFTLERVDFSEDVTDLEAIF